jgi:hypothetical protein
MRAYYLFIYFLPRKQKKYIDNFYWLLSKITNIREIPMNRKNTIIDTNHYIVPLASKFLSNLGDAPFSSGNLVVAFIHETRIESHLSNTHPFC